MRIEGIRRKQRGDRARAIAVVAWENARRRPFELVFETSAKFGGQFDANPNAFLTACYLPAIRHREARVFVDGEICPRLAEGLPTAAGLLAAWWGSPPPIPIESSGSRASLPPGTPREALFLTGGVDSLALLHENRRTFERDDPSAFADALHVSGLLFPGPGDRRVRERHLARVRRALGEIARESGLDLVEVATNLRDLEPDQQFLADEWIGAALASAAHLFGRRWSGVTFASGRDVPHLQPRGTHPLLDPCFSTGGTEIRHRGILDSRLDKLRRIAGWETAIRRLMVCFDAPDGPWPNCGRCEKCVRTMAELIAVGCRESAALFPPGRLEPDSIRALSLTALVDDYWTELLPLLAARGENRLVEAVEDRLASARRAERWLADENWSGKLRRFDRRWFGGGLLALSRRLRRRESARPGEPALS